MNVKELKQHIKELAAQIKALKVELRKPHTFPESAHQQSRLSSLRSEIRSKYFIYAFLRGKSMERVEGRELDSGTIWTIRWYAKKMLPEEALTLFGVWLEPVKTSA
jgi:hypothetical protein